MKYITVHNARVTTSAYVTILARVGDNFLLLAVPAIYRPAITPLLDRSGKLRDGAAIMAAQLAGAFWIKH